MVFGGYGYGFVSGTRSCTRAESSRPLVTLDVASVSLAPLSSIAENEKNITFQFVLHCEIAPGPHPFDRNTFEMIASLTEQRIVLSVTVNSLSEEEGSPGFPLLENGVRCASDVAEIPLIAKYRLAPFRANVHGVELFHSSP